MTPRFRFNLEQGDMELRSCDSRLLTTSSEHTTLDIVRWNSDRDSCFSVAYWTKTDEGHALKFVGSRFLDVDKHDLMLLMRIGQQALDALDDASTSAAV